MSKHKSAPAGQSASEWQRACGRNPALARWQAELDRLRAEAKSPEGLAERQARERERLRKALSAADEAAEEFFASLHPSLQAVMRRQPDPPPDPNRKRLSDLYRRR